MKLELKEKYEKLSRPKLIKECKKQNIKVAAKEQSSSLISELIEKNVESYINKHGEYKVFIESTVHHVEEPFSPGKFKKTSSPKKSPSPKTHSSKQGIDIDAILDLGKSPTSNQTADIVNRINKVLSPPVKLQFEGYEESPPKKKYIPKKYSSLKFQPIQIEKSALDQEYKNKYSITLKEFKQKIKDDSFIKKFNESTIKILKYKHNLYKNIYENTLDEFVRVSEKIKKIREIDPYIDYNALIEMFPMKNKYIGFLTQLKELLVKINERLNDLSEEKTRKNLLDTVNNPIYGLASIIGRKSIKNMIVSQLYAFSKSYKTFTNSFNNIALLGGAGIGKTSIAKVIAYVYSKCGILTLNYVKIASVSDLVGMYVGSTAPKTKAMLMETLEGVLFIDEAYQLGIDNESDKEYGPEAITEIVNFIDKYIGLNIIIVAGYPDIMRKKFFTTNEGLYRRFPYQIILRKYKSNELTDILNSFIESKLGTVLNKKLSDYMFFMVDQLYSHDENIFSNQAGDMLNLGTAIVKSINSSFELAWNQSRFDDCQKLIDEGFNDYLNSKGYMIIF